MTQRSPSTMLLRMRPLFAVACCAACFAVVAASPVAHAQVGAEPGGVPEDDPFADELNPFGRGNGAKPAEQRAAPRQAAPTMPTERSSTGPKSSPRLPVPFPDTTVSGDPAERSERSRPSMRDSRSDDWEPTPAEKLRPAAAITTTRTAGSIARRFSSAVRACTSSSFRALCTSGRFRVRVAVPRASTRVNSTLMEFSTSRFRFL